MIYQLQDGPLDGQEIEVQDTAFEESSEGKVGIKVRRPPVFDSEGEEQEGELVGYYETPAPRTPGALGTLRWSGWR